MAGERERGEMSPLTIFGPCAKLSLKMYLSRNKTNGFGRLNNSIPQTLIGTGTVLSVLRVVSPSRNLYLAPAYTKCWLGSRSERNGLVSSPVENTP